MSKKEEKKISNDEILRRFRRSKNANFQKFLDQHPELFSHPKDDTIYKSEKSKEDK